MVLQYYSVSVILFQTLDLTFGDGSLCPPSLNGITSEQAIVVCLSLTTLGDGARGQVLKTTDRRPSLLITLSVQLFVQRDG